MNLNHIWKINRFFLSVGIIALVFCGVSASGRGGAPAGLCPADMVWIDKGKFCLDKYEFPNREGTVPVHGIDFGEAKRLCKSRGKRLPTQREYILACGGMDRHLYPYGPEYISGRCRSGLGWSDGSSPSGGYPDCATGEGVYDMTGNVWEWVEKTKKIGFLAGGAWNSSEGKASCKSFFFIVGLVISPSVGVRCAMTPGKKPKKPPRVKKPASP